MTATLHREDWYTSERFEASGYAVGLEHHGETDPRGHTFWTDGKAAGAVDGAISNLDDLGWDTDTLFERLLRAPERTLSTLEGPFTLACIDASDDRVLLATDKIGARPPYYTTENGFAFASGLASLVAILDDPSLDYQGVSDLLLMGHMWSDTTLLDGVKALHPATVLEYRDGETTERRYWKPDYTPTSPTDAYFHELTTAFQKTVERTADSVSGDVGLWLSGGLDSRATASELARVHTNGDAFDSLVTYTYDANPGGGVNPKLAAETADVLELPNRTVPLNVEKFLPALERGIEATDGMVNWNTFRNLSAVYNIVNGTPDVLMEGVIGELLGHHLSRYHLTEASSLVESMYLSEASMAAEEVQDLLSVSVDPFGSYRKEVRRIDEPTFERAAVDSHFQNYYPRMAHASNHVPRSQAGTRVPYADGEFLSTAAKLPLEWRMGALPGTDGELIYGVVRPKVRMMRALNADLAEIPYERSRLKPTYPFPLHVLGFYGSVALARLRSIPTYGGNGVSDKWYRSSEEFRRLLDGLLDDAADRPFFDGDAVREYQSQQNQSGANDMNAIGSITTLELWLQNTLE